MFTELLIRIRNVFVKWTIVPEHVWIQTKHLYHTNNQLRKTYFDYLLKKYEKYVKLEVKYQLKVLLCIYQWLDTKYFASRHVHVSVAFYWYQIYSYSSKFDHLFGKNEKYSPEPEEKRAHFTSKQRNMYYVHITHTFYSKWVPFESTIFLEHVCIKTNYLQISWEKSIWQFLKKYEK